MACLLTLTLAACSADELIEMAGPDGTPVRVEDNDSESDMAVGFDMSLAGSHRLNIGEDEAETRAANGVQGTTFAYTTSAQESWSKVAVFWDKGDNNFTRADYTTTAGSATPVGSGFYYATSSQTACHMYGWYPYVNQSHTIQMDQSSTVNYAKSDLLLTTAASASDVATSTRTKTNNVWSETKGTLNFKHVMTKFILKMTAGSGVTINKVELLSVKPTAAISITGGSGTAVSKIALAAASGTAGTLTLFSNANTTNDYTSKSGAAATKNKTAFTNSDGQVTLAAVIPPQSLSGNFIHVNTTAGDVYYTLGSTAKAFTGGQTYTVTFSVTQHEVGKTIDISNWNPSANTNVNIATANTLTMSKSVLVYDYNPTQQTVSSAVTKTAHTGVAPTSYVISKSGSSATGTINASTGAVEIKYGGSNNAGTTTFTVTSKSGSTTLASYTFDVVVNKIKPTVTLGTPAMALAKSGSGSSTVTVTGGGTVRYGSSSNTNVAEGTVSGTTVNVSGKTTVGTCVINLNIDESTNYVAATAAIAVSVGLNESTFSLNKTALTYTYGGANETATISGVTGSNSFSAASSNTGVATVSISGTTVTVTPVAVGTALITVTQAASNSYATSVKTIAVTVNKADNQISLSGDITGTPGVQTDAITISNNKGTVSVAAEKSSGITYSLSGTALRFTIPAGTEPGTYNFVLTDPGNANYRSSTAVVSVTVSASSGGSSSFTYLSSVTSDDVGKVITDDGLVFATVSDAIASHYHPVGIIAYVGSAGSVESGTAYRGLAIGLNDCGNSSTYKWYTANSGTCVSSQSNDVATARGYLDGIASTKILLNDGHTHAAAQAAAGYQANVPPGCSGWFLPSLGQWNLIVKGLTGQSADLTTSSNLALNASACNTKITAAGGTGLTTINYWSSSEFNTLNAWSYAGYSGFAAFSIKTYDYRVRAVLAF